MMEQLIATFLNTYFTQYILYSKVRFTQKKIGINLGCTLISAVCHIKK